MLHLQRSLAVKSRCQELTESIPQSPPPPFLCLSLVPEVGSQLEAGGHGCRHIPDGKIILFLDAVTKDLAVGE